MTASELVEKLQKIIKEEGDFEVEYLDMGEYGTTWPNPIQNVILYNYNLFSTDKNRTSIGVY